MGALGAREASPSDTHSKSEMSSAIRALQETINCDSRGFVGASAGAAAGFSRSLLQDSSSSCPDEIEAISLASPLSRSSRSFVSISKALCSFLMSPYQTMKATRRLG